MENPGEGQEDRLRVLKHNLKTPLTVVKGYLSFWKNDSNLRFPPEKQKEFVLKSLENAEKLEELINTTFEEIMKDYERRK